MYDIAIIGLGPSGSTLARLLDKKYKIIAIDAKTDKHPKCCGGLLAPDAQASISKFDISLPKNILVSPQLFSVRVLDFDNNLEKYYQRFYINMNRKKFDNYLISLIPGNVEIINKLCKKITRKEDYYEIKYDNKTIKSKIVIGADGASSIVRNTFYKKKIKKYLAIQEWYKEENEKPFYSCIFDRKITDSYCWTISKDNSFIVGGAFPTQNAIEKFNLLKEKLIKKGIKFHELLKKEGCYVYINKFNSIEIGKKGAYLIGEASGMISPSSLEGISYAIDSATILAKIINKSINRIDRRYYFKTIKLKIKLYLKLLKKPFMYNKVLRFLIMKSNINAITKE